MLQIDLAAYSSKWNLILIRLLNLEDQRSFPIIFLGVSHFCIQIFVPSGIEVTYFLKNTVLFFFFQRDLYFIHISYVEFELFKLTVCMQFLLTLETVLVTELSQKGKNILNHRSRQFWLSSLEGTLWKLAKHCSWFGGIWKL